MEGGDLAYSEEESCIENWDFVRGMTFGGIRNWDGGSLALLEKAHLKAFLCLTSSRRILDSRPPE